MRVQHMYTRTVSFLLHYVVFTIFFTILLSATGFTYASHINGTWRSWGLLWMSPDKNYNGVLYVASNNCNTNETSAYSRIRNSTVGTPEMSRWKSGIYMVQRSCTGLWASDTDILLNYQTNYQSDPAHGGSHGHNHSWSAAPSFCQFWGVSYPCGRRPEVHLDLAWWNATTALNRERLVMHETGHSQGLQDHCTSDSIMNSGVSTCNGGKWTAIMQYQSTDRSGVSNVYP